MASKAGSWHRTRLGQGERWLVACSSDSFSHVVWWVKVQVSFGSVFRGVCEPQSGSPKPWGAGRREAGVKEQETGMAAGRLRFSGGISAHAFWLAFFFFPFGRRTRVERG